MYSTVIKKYGTLQAVNSEHSLRWPIIMLVNVVSNTKHSILSHQWWAHAFSWNQPKDSHWHLTCMYGMGVQRRWMKAIHLFG